jgi:hypothetical protein
MDGEGGRTCRNLKAKVYLAQREGRWFQRLPQQLSIGAKHAAPQPILAAQSR